MTVDTPVLRETRPKVGPLPHRFYQNARSPWAPLSLRTNSIASRYSGLRCGDLGQSIESGLAAGPRSLALLAAAAGAK